MCAVRELMAETTFYQLLNKYSLPYSTWNKPASALYGEILDGVKFYEGANGLIRFAEVIWIVMTYVDPSTGVMYVVYEEYREFPQTKEQEVRERFYVDLVTGARYPIAISETLKLRGPKLERGLEAAIRALSIQEEGGLPDPQRSRLEIVNVLSPHYKDSVAFKGITSVSVGEIVHYRMTCEEWRAWGDTYESFDEFGVKTVLRKKVLEL